MKKFVPILISALLLLKSCAIWVEEEERYRHHDEGYQAMNPGSK